MRILILVPTILKEHIGHTNIMILTINSVVAEHSKITNFGILFENITFLERIPFYYLKNMRESIEIYQISIKTIFIKYRDRVGGAVLR